MSTNAFQCTQLFYLSLSRPLYSVLSLRFYTHVSVSVAVSLCASPFVISLEVHTSNKVCPVKSGSAVLPTSLTNMIVFFRYSVSLC